MPLPGPKKSVTLQLRTETRVSGAGITNTYSDIVTFNAVFYPLTAKEQVHFDKDTVFSTHRLMVQHDTLGDTYAASLVESNRIVIDSVNYDIEGVQDFDAAPLERHYEVELKKVT